MDDQLLVMPIPHGVKQDTHLTLQVRRPGDEAWTDVPMYAARVDMHNVRQAAVAMFDFSDTVEVRIRPRVSWVYSAVVRPISKGIIPECDGHEVHFTLDKPADLMVEINGERFHCLHLFARPMMTLPSSADVVHIPAKMTGPSTAPAHLKAGTTVFDAGLHVIGEYLCHVPSDTRVVLAPGAVVIGAFICEHAENVVIEGHGIILQEGIHRYSGINGVRVSHCKNLRIEGVTFINPAHYTVYLGGSEDVTVHGIRSFSCEGWSDGIDMMSCRNVRVDGCFLRTSDDCIAIYGRRWAYNGNVRNILVENCTLWADVAHPTIIGTHGDYENDGNILEQITFRNIDVLEHHEPQPGYLGCLAINPGDKNTVRDVLYENIRVEHIEHGKLIDVQVKCNPDYNPAPGKRIERITFRNIRCDCLPPVDSVIAGYDAEHAVADVLLENVTVCGRPVSIQVGHYAEHVTRRD